MPAPWRVDSDVLECGEVDGKGDVPEVVVVDGKGDDC